MKRNISRRWAAVVALAAAVALAAVACEGEKKVAKPPKYVPPAALDRNLNPMELDSLIAMKESYAVTRDQYWDGYGGVLANEAIEVWYADGRVNCLPGMAVLKLMDNTRRETEKLFGRGPTDRLVVVCAGNLDIFRYITGRDWWSYSRIKGDTLNLQAPIDLHTRGLLRIVAPREYYEWAIGELSGHKAPRWIEEGFASHLSNEAATIEAYTPEFGEQGWSMSERDMERELRDEKDRIRTRRALYNAYRMVETLVQRHGRPAVAAFIVASGEEKSLDAAAERTLGVSFDAAVKEARSWAAEETQ